MSRPIDLKGRELGRYRLMSLLGAGGMGAVYDALDVTLGRHVALKILPPELVADPDRVRRFAQEARAASALNHPHLIVVHDIGTVSLDGQELHFIAMEKVDGTTLRDALTGPMPIEGAVELMLQIVDAMAAAHAAGIVHRDLKPENIMISGDGYAKVLDFGLAKLQEDAKPATDPDAKTNVMPTPTGFILGTPGYMSPERARGNRSDHRTDIFALGCILYEVVTGRSAFHGASAFDTLYRVIHDEPEPIASFVPEAPAELQRIVAKALTKDPGERYQSARDLAIDLRGLLRQMRSGDKPGAPVKKQNRVWIAALFVAAAVAGLAALWAWRHNPSRGSEQVIRRITSSGDVVSASISPDGKYVAYIVSNDAGGSLWIRQLGTRQDLRLLPPVQHAGFRGPTFTPDGTGIVYVLLNNENPAGTLFRISTLGGRSERILEGIESAPSFSPDGRRMAYLRADFPRRGQSSLMVAASDGSDARPLATRQYPDLFAPVSFGGGGGAWSSDGALIAAAVNRAQSPQEATLFGFNLEGGAPKPLSDAKWRTLGQAAWLPDLSGLVVVGTLQDDPLAAAEIPLRLWFLPYPTGPPRRLTNDLLFYRTATISADGRSLVTVGVDVTTQIWRVPLTGEGRAQKISTGRLEGWNGVSVAPDGRIVFSAVDDTQVTVVIANADGSNPVPLTREAGLFPAAFSGGVAYIAPGVSGNEIRVTDYHGRNVRTVVRGVDADMLAMTRDGQWLAYHLNRLLWKVRLDGSGNQQLTTLQTTFCSWSPSGDRLALLYDDAGQRRLGIMSSAGGGVTWSIPYSYRIGSTVRWTPDGTALLVNDQPNDLANIWKVPFEGPPQKLTRLSEQDAYVFDVSPDGKTAAVSRGRLSRDAILITGFR
jgi:serine/threonine protein kinase